jgi:hypothetical protein
MPYPIHSDKPIEHFLNGSYNFPAIVNLIKPLGSLLKGKSRLAEFTV